MKFQMSVDDFLGLIDVADLANVMKVIEESMSPGGEKKTEVTTTTSHLNGTK